jgi:hypothetical protein
MEQHAQEIIKQAKENPNKMRNASLLFNKGLSANKLSRFAAREALNIVNLEAKIYASSNDETITIWMNDLLAYEGTPSQKLAFFEARHRLIVRRSHKEKMAMLSSDATDDRQKVQGAMQQLLRLPLQYYKVDVLQTNAAIARLMTMTEIAGIKLPTDQSNALMSLMQTSQLQLQELEAQGTLIESFGLQTMNALVETMPIIPLPESDPEPEPEPEPEPSTGPRFCGPGIPNESNCPPDASWLPSPSKISGASNSSYSYIYNYTSGGNSDGYDDPVLRWSRGSFHSTLRWSLATDNSKFTNTAAFKRSGLKHCDPDIDFGRLDAQCSEQNDNIFVPAATYEDEGEIDNPACLTARSPDTNYNRVNGCWEPSYASSSLPYAYLDTTLSDGPSQYSASIGTYRPDYLIEGRAYSNYTEFWGYEHNNMLLRKYVHKGQVGTQYGLYSPFAVFSVDTSRLTGNVFYFPIITF